MGIIHMTIFLLGLHLLLLLHLAKASTSSIHELLKSKGLPPGLFPKEVVKSYELEEGGLLQVYLERPCLTKFETMVFYDTLVRANLTYGRLIGLQGLSQQELFLWLPVRDIIVYDPSSGLILFDIGVARKQMSLSLFEDPPICHPQLGWTMDGSPRKESGFYQVQR